MGAALGVVLIAAAAPCHARSVEDVIANEVTRHRETVSRLKEPILGAEEKKSLEQQLATVAGLAQAGRTPAALQGLLRVARYLDAQDFRAGHAAQIQDGLPALQRDWQENGRERQQQVETHGRLAPRIASAVARALSESSFYEARIVHEASLVYGGQVGAEAGYFYLGESRALMAFTLLLDSMPAVGTGEPPRLGPLGPLLARLEQQLLDAYGRDTASPEASAFARANGALKLARELDKEKSAFGALYQYLLAEQALGQALAPLAPADPAALRRAADELTRQIQGEKTDHSLGLAFVQQGVSALDRAASAADPKPLLANAQALLERVVPAYRNVAGE